MESVRGLLEPDGVFIFSLYSEQACADLDLLKIYQKHDLERLAAWTPSSDEVLRRLHAAGFTVVDMPRPGQARLDLYVCQPAS